MKTIPILLLVFSLCACSKTDSSPENAVYIMLIANKEIYNDSITVQVVKAKPRQLSIGFWNHFRQQYPRSFSLIFQSAQPMQQHGFPGIDPSYLAAKPGVEILDSLRKLLPERAFQKEVDGVNTPDERNVKIKYFIGKDYERFLAILNDTSNSPVFIFSREFAQKKNY